MNQVLQCAAIIYFIFGSISYIFHIIRAHKMERIDKHYNNEIEVLRHNFKLALEEKDLYKKQASDLMEINKGLRERIK